MDADMGGTEIGQAVAAAIKSQVPDGISKEVLLITDGEVWEWEKLIPEAAKSGLRFFTVGVGNSVLIPEAAKSGLRFFTVGVGNSVSEAFVQWKFRV
jgi:Ca-activated chloride channel family protein